MSSCKFQFYSCQHIHYMLKD
uniref:Uncharacterized protein n=1 Tax=Rhizophora mucronata TaxID=61149 RepID=A0A2P2QBN5_RHIMU